MGDLAVARRAALAGADVALRHFRAPGAPPPERKADGSVVTPADRAVEVAIRAVLRRERPGDAVLGEEAGPSGPAGRRRWIVDPIDGTALFVAGDDRWLVLVALEDDGRVVAAVAAVPAQARMWWAERGGGAHRSGLSDRGGQPIAVDRRRDRPLAGIVPLALSPAEAAMVAPLDTVATTADWAAHPGLLVADGSLDLAVQTRGKVWDYAATSLIVEEAGGVFSMGDGSRRPGTGTAVYARDPDTHAAARRAITTLEGAR
jgi:histidinol-phosphatase